MSERSGRRDPDPERCVGGCGRPALLTGCCVVYWRHRAAGGCDMSPILPDGRCLRCGRAVDDHPSGALVTVRVTGREEEPLSFRRPYLRCDHPPRAELARAEGEAPCYPFEYEG